MLASAADAGSMFLTGVVYVCVCVLERGVAGFKAAFFFFFFSWNASLVLVCPGKRYCSQSSECFQDLSLVILIFSSRLAHQKM